MQNVQNYLSENNTDNIEVLITDHIDDLPRIARLRICGRAVISTSYVTQSSLLSNLSRFCFCNVNFAGSVYSESTWTTNVVVSELI